MTATQRLKLGSTNALSITGLRVTVGGTYPITATIVVSLLDSTGATVTGAGGLACAYVSGTGKNSLYAGAIPSTVALVEGDSYTARVTATSGVNVRRFDIPCVAEAG